MNKSSQCGPRPCAFKPGIATLLDGHRDWLQGRRVALLSHPAAVDARGVASADRLMRTPGVRVTAFFGPEHGFFGGALAGEPVKTRRHPLWKVPVHSLYGATRRPTPAMLRNVDVLVVDLQDVGARCYTFVSTLRFVLEAAAAHGKAVIVADRPIPLPSVLDGPLTDPTFESFVAAVPAPLAYGMTPAESALWIKAALGLQVDLRVAPMAGYRRDPWRQADWPPWIPPSPGIVSWESAACYTATVFTEAFPGIDHGRRAGLPFQLIGAPWFKGRALCERLAEHRLAGVAFHPHSYAVESPLFGRRMIEGVRLTVTDADAFRPVTTSLCLVSALQAIRGVKRLWAGDGARPEFFDKLYGADAVRTALMDGVDPLAIARTWRRDLAAFAAARQPCLLYQP